MQDDNQPVAPMSQAPDFSAPSQPNVSQRENIYETLMLVFGFLAILSLLINNGFLLKLSAVVFLMVAVITIVRGLASSRQSAAPTTVQQPDGSAAPVRRKRSLLKILGITLLVIISLPVLGYMALWGFFIIILLFGGGDMGS